MLPDVLSEYPRRLPDLLWPGVSRMKASCGDAERASEEQFVEREKDLFLAFEDSVEDSVIDPCSPSKIRDGRGRRALVNRKMRRGREDPLPVVLGQFHTRDPRTPSSKSELRLKGWLDYQRQRETVDRSKLSPLMIRAPYHVLAKPPE